MEPPQDRVASPLHTIVLLVAMALFAWLGVQNAARLRVAVHPNPVPIYLRTMAFEWAMLAFVIWGVRRHGTPLREVLGDRWGSFRRLLIDIGIAAAFWVVSLVFLAMLAHLLGITAPSRSLQYLLPHGSLQIALWIVLSTTAGICEEAIFRGYLQRQCVALTRNIPAGILLAAAAFGAGHAYQGGRQTVLIGGYGVMFGVLAYWRRSVRPGMMAHAFQDSLSGIAASLIRK